MNSTFDRVIDAATISVVGEALFKLVLAMVLGAIVGVERELSGRPAGARTHMLVCLGAALFTLISVSFGSATPDRIAAQVVTGIGFLGAGTILRSGPEIKGLTTASSIWAVAAIGMSIAVGGPFYWIALAAAIMTLVTLRLVRRFEREVLDSERESAVDLVVTGTSVVTEVITSLQAAGARLHRFEMSPSGEQTLVQISFIGRPTGILDVLAKVRGVVSAQWAD